MKGLYQILAEDYRDYQLKEPLRESSRNLIESTRPSKLKKSLKEAEEEVKVEEPVVAEETPVAEQPVAEAPIEEPVAEEAPVVEEAPAEAAPEAITESEEEIIKGSEEVEEVIPDEVTEETPEEVLSKIAMVAGLSKEEIEKAMAELPEEEKEAVKANFTAIKNTAMELFPEEVEEDVEEITEEIPEETFEECEISSFRVTRISPKVGAVMIEAQTKEGLKYITGKNFNESEKTLDEAEISTDKAAAANRFKSLLK